jgi:hypothetical protein
MKDYVKGLKENGESYRITKLKGYSKKYQVWFEI